MLLQTATSTSFFDSTINISFMFLAVTFFSQLAISLGIAYMNNKHQLRMKELEHEHEFETKKNDDDQRRKEKYYNEEVKLFIDFLAAAGAVSKWASDKNLSEYGRLSAIVRAKVPADLEHEIYLLDQTLTLSSTQRSSDELGFVINGIKSHLESMTKNLEE